MPAGVGYPSGKMSHGHNSKKKARAKTESPGMMGGDPTKSNGYGGARQHSQRGARVS